MRSKKEIKRKIKQIEADVSLSEIIRDNCNSKPDKILTTVSIGAGKKQIELLKWVLNK